MGENKSSSSSSQRLETFKPTVDAPSANEQGLLNAMSGYYTQNQQGTPDFAPFLQNLGALASNTKYEQDMANQMPQYANYLTGLNSSYIQPALQQFQDLNNRVNQGYSENLANTQNKFNELYGQNTALNQQIQQATGQTTQDVNPYLQYGQQVLPQMQTNVNQYNTAMSSLAKGELPSAYQTNMENALRSGINRTLGGAVEGLSNRGVLNSSIMQGTVKDIGKSVADTMAQNFSNNMGLQSNILGSQFGNVNTGLTGQGTQAQGFGNLALDKGKTTVSQLGQAQQGIGQGGTLAGNQASTTNQTLSGISGSANQGLTGALSSVGQAATNVGNASNMWNTGLNARTSELGRVQAPVNAITSSGQNAMNLWGNLANQRYSLATKPVTLGSTSSNSGGWSLGVMPQ